MPTFNAEIANESPYSFTLLGEHLPSAAWAVPSKKDVADKLTTIPPKTTVSMYDRCLRVWTTTVLRFQMLGA